MIESVDVAIIGGGPGGLQAALVLARTRKKIVIFDTPTAPRNGASHGVHNVLGLDGLLPSDIRTQAWSQIDAYQQAELRRCEVLDIQAIKNGFIIETKDNSLEAKKVILAMGFKDKYPKLNGFSEAWANTIIPCPFCDGYENRDRTWGIIANLVEFANHFPILSLNWTSTVKLILNDPEIRLDAEVIADLESRSISIHYGPITAINQKNGEVNSVEVQSRETIPVETLWWVPERVKTDLEEQLIARFGLELDETGLLRVNELKETSRTGLYAVGDIVRGGPSVLGAMEDGNKAAHSIIKEWHV